MEKEKLSEKLKRVIPFRRIQRITGGCVSLALK